MLELLSLPLGRLSRCHRAKAQLLSELVLDLWPDSVCRYKRDRVPRVLKSDPVKRKFFQNLVVFVVGHLGFCII